MRHFLAFLLAVAAVTCGGTPPSPAPPMPVAGEAPLPSIPVTSPTRFGDDVAFLKAHTPIVTLTSAGGRALVAVAPGYQGRVMTSSAAGEGGMSFGYLHRSVIALEARQPRMTVLGGEDRFWLGPEGGPFALHFAPGAAFDVDHWQVPEPIDWGAWPVTNQTPTSVSFGQKFSVKNYAGTTLSMVVDRTIRILDAEAIGGVLGRLPSDATSVVAYESENRITNTGRAAWTRATGMPSIWILGMFPPGPRTTVVIPYVAGETSALGPVVNDSYFGAISPERLRVTERAIFFRGDGTSRGKIGVPRPRAKDIAGSYDPDRGVLTIVQYTLPEGARDYVNSMWARQTQPFRGDVVNSYNDGPLAPGEAPLGPFYEIESSSPAAALRPGASLTHVHRTIHLQGPGTDLDLIARVALGVSLSEIAAALPEPTR